MSIKRNGFTLVEILIVIVILAVLASLVLPRMLAQPERVLVGEAFNYLGVIRRTQENMVGILQGSWLGGSCAPGGTGDTGWQDMGMGVVPSTSSFGYSCTAGAYTSGSATSVADSAGTCTATRTDVPAGNPKSGGTITMRLNTGTITACGAPYMLLGTAGNRGSTCS